MFASKKLLVVATRPNNNVSTRKAKINLVLNWVTVGLIVACIEACIVAAVLFIFIHMGYSRWVIAAIIEKII